MQQRVLDDQLLARVQFAERRFLSLGLGSGVSPSNCRASRLRNYLPISCAIDSDQASAPHGRIVMADTSADSSLRHSLCEERQRCYSFKCALKARGRTAAAAMADNVCLSR